MVELTDELITHSAEFQHDISLEVLPRYVSNSTCSFFLVSGSSYKVCDPQGSDGEKLSSTPPIIWPRHPPFHPRVRG